MAVRFRICKSLLGQHWFPNLLDEILVTVRWFWVSWLVWRLYGSALALHFPASGSGFESNQSHMITIKHATISCARQCHATPHHVIPECIAKPVGNVLRAFIQAILKKWLEPYVDCLVVSW